MMGKKEYQLFADAVSLIDDNQRRKDIIDFLYGIFKTDNIRFDINRFMDWVDRRRNNKSMKGTHYNSKYMPLGIK